MSLRPVEVNGGPGALFLDAQQRLIGVLALDNAGQITSISSIVNPDKLRHLGPVGDLKIATEVGEMNSGVAAPPRAGRHNRNDHNATKR